MADDPGLRGHDKHCQCTAHACLRWLEWEPEEDRRTYFATLKLASYGGPRGTGEPDRAFDRVCGEADMHRALIAVGRAEPFLAAVGDAYRTLEPPEGEHVRPGRDVVEYLRQKWPLEWESAVMRHRQWTLRWLVERCAVAMAASLGLRLASSPWADPWEAAPEPPPERPRVAAAR